MQPAGVDARPLKTVIVLTGFDGTAEEVYFQTSQAALDRGWNVLIAEGPGQAGLLRFHTNVVFRPDYEAPVGAMIDYAPSRPEIDPERLPLWHQLRRVFRAASCRVVGTKMGEILGQQFHH